MRRIGINASFLRKPATGIGQVTLHFLNELMWQEGGDMKKHDFEFYLYLEEDTDILFPKNFHKRVFQPLWKRDDLVRKILWEKVLLPKMAQRDKCDVFLSLYQSPTIMPFHMRHIMLVHDIIPKLFPEYLDNRRKKYYYGKIEKGIQYADKILAISKRTEKDLIQEMDIEANTVAINYPDVDPIFKKNVGQRSKLKVLRKYGLTEGYLYYGGGLEMRKNVERLLLAYKKLLDRNRLGADIGMPVPPLVISGKLLPQLAPLVTDVESMAKLHNLTQHVRILGHVPQEDLPELYAGASAFLFPSLYEGFGLPVLEAMNMGTPVITSKTSSLPEVGGDGVLYCNPYDVDDIVQVIRMIFMNKNLRSALRTRAKERAKKFSWEKFVSKTVISLES